MSVPRSLRKPKPIQHPPWSTNINRHNLSALDREAAETKRMGLLPSFLPVSGCQTGLPRPTPTYTPAISGTDGTDREQAPLLPATGSSRQLHPRLCTKWEEGNSEIGILDWPKVQSRKTTTERVGLRNLLLLSDICFSAKQKSKDETKQGP